MKFNSEITIDVPRTKVIEYFDSFENMKHWQEGLIGYEVLSGEPGQPGAKTRLSYKMGKRDIEMTETILTRNLPDEFSGTYEARGVWNEVKNYFEEQENDRTLWRMENEFVFSGFFMKLMGFFMPGAFRKQTAKSMAAFKRFAEQKIEKENAKQSGRNN